MSQPSQGLTPSRQSQSGRQRAPQCVRCGSRTWMRDRNRGVMICSEGHVLEGYIRESTVQTEISQHSTRVRRVKVGKVKKEYVLKDVYTDEHERLLLLHIYTILIRKQTEVLIKVFRAPPVLEIVVNSFWRAYLNTLSLSPIRLLSSRSFSPSSSCFPNHSQSGFSSEDSRFTDNRSRFSSPAAISTDLDSGTPLTPETLKAITEDELSSSDDSDRTPRFHPPQSDDESQYTSQTNDSRSLSGRKRRRRKRFSKDHPKIESTLGILYLACTRLRLPIIMQDLINLMCSKELPYIGFLSELPDHLKAKASRATITHLSIHKPPRLYRDYHQNGLASQCYKLASELRKREAELLPTKDCIINIPLIALRFSQMLLIPHPIHALALHIISKLDPMCFGFITSTKIKRKSQRKKLDFDFQFPPDWVLMSCLISTIQIILKGIKNNTNNLNGFYELVKKSLPKLKNWIEAIHSLRNSIDLKNPQRLCGLDVQSIQGDDLDAYIDLAENFLLSEKLGTNSVAIEDLYFPLLNQQKPMKETNQETIYEEISKNLLNQSNNNTETSNNNDDDDLHHSNELIALLIQYASIIIGSKEKDFKKLLGLIHEKICHEFSK